MNVGEKSAGLPERKARAVLPYSAGIILINQREWHGAILEFQKCKPTPDEPNFAARMHIARCLIHLEKHGCALFIMDELEKEGANMGQLFFERGRLKTHLHNTKGAIEDFTETIMLDYNVKNTYYFRGRAHRYNGDYDEALLDFEAAEKLGYNRSKLYYEWARVCFELNEFEEAYLKIDKAIGMGFDNGYAFYIRGFCRANKSCQDHLGAIGDYDKALELGYAKDDLFLGRGISKYKLGNKKGSRQDFEAVLEKNPDDKTALFYLGRCLVRLKEHEMAWEALRKIEPYYQTNAIYQFNAAKIMLALNEYIMAIAYAEKALQNGLRERKMALDIIDNAKKAMNGE